MNKLERAAMQQALEALDTAYGLAESDWTEQKYNKAITALREALAEQEEQQPVHEALQIASVALQDIACSSQTENLYWWQLRARKAQKQIAESLIKAAPVRTKDLTDDEIDAFIDRAWDKQMSMPEIIRAAIAADREKNK